MLTSPLLRLLALPLPLLTLTRADLFGFGSSSWPDESQPTTFNGKTVPIPTYFEDHMSFWNATHDGGVWLVEFFSPYCGHCEHFAPTWKTLYEYYYTQEPVPQSRDSGSSGGGAADNDGEDLNSFTHFYNFHFAKIDCVAHGDLCHTYNVHAFPTIRFYKNGEVIKEAVGGRDLKFMVEGVEEILETIRPGSRPQGGPTLPKVGATSAAPVPANEPTQVSSPTDVGKDGKSPLVATRIESVPQGTPNPLGKSVDLTAETFQRRVTMTRDLWFIKFYSPTCPHCIAMAPNWQGMARQMEGALNIGEVNCDVQKRLCKDVKVRGYPTILLFRGGERIEYDGLRGLGDLVSYATKALSVQHGVPSVTAAEFEELEKSHEVIFLYFYDVATTTEDFAALDRLPISLIAHAILVKTSDPLLAARFKITTWPRFIVSRDGKPSYYPALSPRDMRDNRRVLGWMQRVWLPIVPELTASNAHEIMDGKLVVLGILSRERPEEFAAAKAEIKTAALEWIDKQALAFKLALDELRYAKQLRIEEAQDRNDQRGLRSAKNIKISTGDIEIRDVRFAWVDGVFWERWIKTTFGISVARGGEKVVVNDEDHQRYWDVTMTGNPIVPSRTSILETLPRIVASPPKIAPKSKLTPLGHIWWVVRGHMWEHPFVSAFLALVILGGAGLWGKRVVWRSGERAYGYFRVGEKGGPMDGLLGGGLGGGGLGMGPGVGGGGKKD